MKCKLFKLFMTQKYLKVKILTPISSHVIYNINTKLLKFM